MGASFLRGVFDTVYLCALTAWVGSILFFSFGVAPIIFRVLDKDSGARFVRALFPRYYAWGVVSSAIALPAALGVPLAYPRLRGPWVALQALVIVSGTLIFLYCGQSLTPAINAARDEGAPGQERFARLHRRSVRLNVLALAIGLGLLIAFPFRPVPTTGGIVEPTPLQRYRAVLENEARRRQAIEASPPLGSPRPRP